LISNSLNSKSPSDLEFVFWDFLPDMIIFATPLKRGPAGEPDKYAPGRPVKG
jgi:hypothetical protein